MTLIKQEDAIEAIKKEIQDFEANYMHGEDDEEFGHDIGFVAGLHRAKTFIRSLPSSKDDWIPCSERLPQPTDETQRRGWYLTTNEHKSVGITCYEFYGIKSKGWRSDFEILAWMPLPMPYRKDGEDE